MRRHKRCFRQFRIGQNKAETLERSEIIGEEGAGEAAFGKAAQNGGFVEIKLMFRRFAAINFRIIDLRIGAVFALHDGLIAFLGERFKSGVFQDRAGAQHRHRHDGFFDGFDSGGRVLIIGGAFLDAAIGSAQNTERNADYGFGSGENRFGGGVAETADSAESDEVGTMRFQRLGNSFFQRIHARIPFVFRCR